FGARTQEVTTDIANSLGLDRPRGALITEVAPGGSAERAGFRPGDVILSVDGIVIQQPSAFDFRLATRQIGSEVTITYFRDGREQEMRVTLEGTPRSGELVTVSGNTRFSGVAVESMNPAAAEELGVPYDSRGVIVRQVAPGSPADQIGLRPSDIILALNGQEIADAKTFRSIADARPNAWQIVLQ